MKRLSHALLLLASLLVGCRRGSIAGAGAACDDRHLCRVGYGCRARVCQANGAPALDAADRAADVQPPTADLRGGEVVASADAPVDAAPPARPPSLERCTEYDLFGQPAACDPMRPTTVEALALSRNDLVALRGGEIFKLFRIDPATFGPVAVPFQPEGNLSDHGDLTLSPDGAALAADGGELTIWRTSTGTRDLAITRPPFLVRALCFAPDSDHLLADPPLRLWSLSKRAPEGPLPVDINAGITCDRWATTDGPWWAAEATFHRTDGSVPAAGLTFIELRAYGALVRTPSQLALTGLRVLELGPGGTTLAVAREEGIGIWDTSIKSDPRPPAAMLRGPLPPDEVVRWMRFSPSGRHLLVVTQPFVEAGSDVPYSDLIIVAVDTGATVGHRRVQGSASQVAFTADGRALLATSDRCHTFLYCRD
jgi:hypothetical protein